MKNKKDYRSFIELQLTKGNINWESRSDLIRSSGQKISGHNNRILKEYENKFNFGSITEIKNKAIKRRSLQIACLSASEYGIPISLCGADRMLWGRRSLFTLNTNSLLVSEIFLPSLILKINS